MLREGKAFSCATTPVVPWATGATVARGAAGPYRWKAEVMVGKEAAFPSAGRPSNCSAVPSSE
jgi:hypothetical protein